LKTDKEERMPRKGTLTRREFLKGAAAVAMGAPYVITSGVLGAQGQPAATDRIQVAAIGVRARGNSLMEEVLKRDDGQIVAICDVDAKVREGRVKQVEETYAKRAGEGSFKGVAAYNDFRELMQRKDIDAVIIATPDHTHGVIAIAAANAGKDIYVEKPMTHNIREGRAMVKAVRENKVILQVGSQRRSDSGVRKTCELVRNGRIGKLQTVVVGIGVRPTEPELYQPEPVPEGFDYELWLGPAPWKPYTAKRCHYTFRFIRDYSGGEITNFGAHHLDVAQWGIGADDSGPVEIEGAGEAFETGLYDTYHHFRIEYTYANGVKVVCSTENKDGTHFEGTIPWEKADRSDIGLDGVCLYRTESGHMGNWLECIRTRKDPSAPVEVGHRSVTLCHLGNIALDLGRKVKWDPVKEEFPGDDMANALRERSYRKPWIL
jgi:predicted dehydrogenase